MMLPNWVMRQLQENNQHQRAFKDHITEKLFDRKRKEKKKNREGLTQCFQTWTNYPELGQSGFSSGNDTQTHYAITTETFKVT